MCYAVKEYVHQEEEGVKKDMMINETFVNSELFLSLPLSAQVLYFHLAARADSAGYILNPFEICKRVNAIEEDYKILLKKRIIEKAENESCGVYVST